jgi:hypothetical protein
MLQVAAVGPIENTVLVVELEIDRLRQTVVEDLDVGPGRCSLAGGNFDIGTEDKSSRGSGDLFRQLACRYRGLVRTVAEHQQGRIQVDETPGVSARSYGAVIRVAGSRSMLPDPYFETILIIAMLACYRLRADATRPELRRPSV